MPPHQNILRCSELLQPPSAPIGNLAQRASIDQGVCIDHLESGAFEELLHLEEREESQVSRVEHPGSPVGEATLPDEIEENREEANVRDARQELTAGSQLRGQGAQQSPRVRDVLENVAAGNSMVGAL